MKSRVHAARRVGFLIPLIVFLVSVPDTSATMVEYSGQVNLFGQPVENAFVIAGTFDPSFGPFGFGYQCFYGVDEVCNMGSSEYPRAVADGNFRPIGNGTHTSESGAFHGSGIASDISGLPLFIFALKDFGSAPTDPESYPLYFAITTSSNPAWIADDNNVIDASDADLYVHGRSNGGAMELWAPPVPEPASGHLLISGVLLVLLMFRHRCFRRRLTEA